MPELKYRFPNLSIHDAIIVQSAIETRLTEMSRDLKGSDRAIKAIVEELGLMHDDLDRHIAAIEREQYYYEKAKREKELLKPD